MHPAPTVLLLCVFSLLSARPGHAQDGQAHYTAFIEILGNTGVASLNFDTVNDSGYGFRVGGFVDPTPLFACRDNSFRCRSRNRDRDREPNATAYLVAMGHRLVGESAHRLELGFGVLVGHAEPGVADFLPRAALTATVGYRFQPDVGRVGVRVGFTPIVAPDRVLLRPGFSVSYGLPTPR